MKMEVLNNSTFALCFNKADFMLTDFSVDSFVSNCRKYVSIEAMLEDLGLYHKFLCSSMVQLINQDYSDFVNLSSNLVGLDKAIKNLSHPLEKLRTEVGDEKNNLNEILKNMKKIFFAYSCVHKQRGQAKFILCFIEDFKKIEHLSFSRGVCVSDKLLPTEVEKIALELSIIQFYMKKISFNKNVCVCDDDSERDLREKVLEQLTEKIFYIKEHLEYMFLQTLSENDVSGLLKILRIYSFNSHTEKEAENYFRKIFAKPYMNKHVTEANILKYGLAAVYERILNFIPNFCSTILNATQQCLSKRYSDLSVVGYDFLVNSVFTEVVHAFELVNPVHIYAPGDPELFHHNFTSTISFLEQFECYCGWSSVKKLRSHVLYKTFISKWNYNLYFEIRFQEIAGNFESCLLAETFDAREPQNFTEDTGGSSNKDKYRLSLNVSKTLLQCVQRCWDNNTFLYHLSSRFYQLTLQLISRFSKWLSTSLKNDLDLSPIQVAMIIKDVEYLQSDLKFLFEDQISSKFSRQLVEGPFRESLKVLQTILPVATSLLVKLLLTQCISHLKMINDIPRMYRKTNRNIPSKPSSYVALVFDILEDFLISTMFLSSETKYSCLKEVIEGILLECSLLIEEVLTAIKKMEDSLKILKRARDKREPQALGHTSDDDKIRRQLAIDVQIIKDKIESFGLEVENLKNFKELEQLINLSKKQLT